MERVTKEQIFDLVLSLSDGLQGLLNSVADLRLDAIMIRSDLNAAQGDLLSLRAETMIVNQRLDRIERQLDLREMAEAGVPFLHQA